MGHAPHFSNLGMVQNFVVGLDEGTGIITQLRGVQPVADDVVVDGGVDQVVQLLHLGLLDVGDGRVFVHCATFLSLGGGFFPHLLIIL